MKKIILLLAISLLLSGCLPKKVDETKTIGQPEPATLEEVEKELNDTQIEDVNQELNALDQDINQL